MDALYGSYMYSYDYDQHKINRPDNRKFEGTWINGRRNGMGTMTYADNTKEIAEWKDDIKMIVLKRDDSSKKI